MIATSHFLADQAEISYADAPSGRFGYRRFGPAGGVPLVLVTRFRGTIDHWDPALLDVLAAERDVIVVDYPGVNLSSGSAPGTVAGLAGSIAEFIDALDLRQVDLLGWSMGGYVVQDLCLNRPALVRRLDVRLAASGAAASAESTAAQTSALGGWAKGENTSWDRLGELALPVLVGAGGHDLLMHPFGAYSMATRLPDAKVVLYSDGGHGFLFQHADDFGREVVDFLR